LLRQQQATVKQAKLSRSACRYMFEPDFRGNNFGLRVCFFVE
jgi:hypothetical protein